MPCCCFTLTYHNMRDCIHFFLKHSMELKYRPETMTLLSVRVINRL